MSADECAWIKNLKAGDEVLVDIGQRDTVLSLRNVRRVTKQHGGTVEVWALNDRVVKFNLHGRERSVGGYHWQNLVEPTAANLAVYRHQQNMNELNERLARLRGCGAEVTPKQLAGLLAATEFLA